MKPRRTVVLLTTQELALITWLLQRHVRVAMYENETVQHQLMERFEEIYKFAKELEPV